MLCFFKGERRTRQFYLDQIRDAGPHKNYRRAMDFIVAQGWNVLALGETCVEEFGGSDILTSASDVDLDDELLELYALTRRGLY